MFNLIIFNKEGKNQNKLLPVLSDLQALTNSSEKTQGKKWYAAAKTNYSPALKIDDNVININANTM